ncbi:MAG: T9SS type A sorting domain-containing protein [Ignavibacteria bacterium]|nr:T9SS type A sorting domain-containing protein [Ignavibacteria bacterium]MCU7502061.1 T9SS type A sorting domain-containing protein [Ignavibacteria bacterium]MCU7515463.1 T9SS type A sorting domain-containing protein [Ignavibacteria bacterium]
MKKYLLLMAAFVTLSFAVNAQRITKADYYFAGHIDTTMGTGSGIIVDPEGKIWYGTESDTTGLIVLGKDLKPVSFSGIKTLTLNGVSHNVKTKLKGITTDNNGNIIATITSELYRINYKTGELMNFASYKDFSGRTNAGSLTKPSVDAAGNIYVAKVGPAGSGSGANENPIWILNPDFSYKGSVIDTQITWSRSVLASKDGKDVYLGTLGKAVEHYILGDDGKYTLDENSPEPVGIWEGEPPIGEWGGGIVASTVDKAGNVWFSDEGANTIFIYNPTTKQFSQIRGIDPALTDLNVPRALALSATEDTVYVCNFGTKGYTSMFIRGGGFKGTEVFDDFTDNNTTNAWGGEWTKFGAGTINLAVTDGALHVTGTWSGYGGVQSTMTANPDTNISRFDGIQFRAKAGANTNEAWIRIREAKADADRGYAYFVYKFTPTAEWQTYTVPWTALTVQYGDPIPAFDATDITSIDFAASKGNVEADFYVDDIAFYGVGATVVPGGTSGVEKVGGKSVPAAYKLEQNYPNPFNPTTQIQFSLKQSGNVTLKVYDVVGREVATLFNNEYMGAGTYKAQFSGANLASGMYIYRLNVNGNILTNKMMLLK